MQARESPALTEAIHDKQSPIFPPHSSRIGWIVPQIQKFVSQSPHDSLLFEIQSSDSPKNPQKELI
jgi:hypothetical protein